MNHWTLKPELLNSQRDAVSSLEAAEPWEKQAARAGNSRGGERWRGRSLQCTRVLVRQKHELQRHWKGTSQGIREHLEFPAGQEATLLLDGNPPAGQPFYLWGCSTRGWICFQLCFISVFSLWGFCIFTCSDSSLQSEETASYATSAGAEPAAEGGDLFYLLGKQHLG